MSTADCRLIVFVDTSYLRKKAKTQSADWNRLLILAQNRDIEIHVSEIAIEEYRSQCVDLLHAKIEKSRNTIRQLQKEWASNPIAANLGESIDSDIFPNIDQLEEESSKIITELVNDNHINVISPTEEHGKRVWHDYFRWHSIFSFASPTNRDDKATRDSRRKQIPDAWILEAATDLNNENSNVVCLCGDEGLTEQLVGRRITTVANAEDIQKMVEGDYPAPETEKTAESQVEDEEKIEGEKAASVLHEKLEAIDKKENTLQLRILGYTHFFTPLSKSDLEKLLEERGHTKAQISVAANRLVVHDLLRDTGSHYLVVDNLFGKEAATAVMEEIVEKL